MPSITIREEGRDIPIDVTGLPERALYDLVRDMALDIDTAQQLEKQFNDPAYWLDAYSSRVSEEHMATIWHHVSPEIQLACRSPYRPLPNLMLRYDVRLGLSADWNDPDALVTILRRQSGDRIAPHPQHRLQTVEELGGDPISAAGHFVDEMERVVGLDSAFDESAELYYHDWQVFDAHPRSNPGRESRPEHPSGPR